MSDGTGMGEATDRDLRTEADLDRLDFDKQDGLIPVVVQDAARRDVLMVAWADRAALEATLRTGQMHFWSRSRGEQWRKGETSGNVQKVRSLHADCDADTVLARVDPEGPACHTGERTCFGREYEEAGAGGAGDAEETPGSIAGPVLGALWEVLEARNRERPDGSYTTRLLEDENLRLKKLGEETAELLVALTRREEGRIPEEGADLLYHLLVALLGSDVELAAVLKELEDRSSG